MKPWKLKTYLEIKNDFGSLLAVEFDQVPFPIKRLYFLYKNSPDYSRGFHAHKNLKQSIFCLSGECKIVLDDGKFRETVSLDQPNNALEIVGMVWREIYNLSTDSVVLVLASEPYSPEDYIHDYDDFIQYLGDRSCGKK